MTDRKYFLDDLKRTLVKAYMDDGKFILEIITLIPKYRGGYRRDLLTKQFDSKEYANNYFKKVKANHSLKAVTFPGMANGHVEY